MIFLHSVSIYNRTMVMMVNQLRVAMVDNMRKRKKINGMRKVMHLFIDIQLVNVLKALGFLENGLHLGPHFQ